MVKSVLFACNMNSVRSPMAEAVAKHMHGDWLKVSSCGVYKGAPDPFVVMALKEKDIAPPSHEPQEFGDADLDGFELIVALTPEAAAEARKLHANVQYWDVDNPTDTRGSEAEIVAAYGKLRDDLLVRMQTAFQRD